MSDPAPTTSEKPLYPTVPSQDLPSPAESPPSTSPLPLAPPYSSSSGSGASSPSLDLAGVSATAQVIKLDGRYPLTIICPYCQNNIRTETQSSKNQDGNLSICETYFQVTIYTALLMMGVFFFAAIVTRKYFLYFGLLVGFALVLGLFIAFALTGHKGQFDDVTHKCPECQKELGISLGTDEWHESQRRNNRWPTD